MIAMIKNKKWIFILYLSWLIPAMMAYVWISNIPFSLWLNSFQNPIADYFFSYTTFLGDGFAVCAVILLLLFFDSKKSRLVFFNYVLSSGFTQLLKHFVFMQHKRPLAIIEHSRLHFPEGMQWNYLNSFPSGHSTTAFALFSLLAFMSDNKYVQMLCMILSIAVAISRIYLLQHFLGDTIAGSFIGFFVSSLMYYYFIYKKLNKTEL